MGLVEVSGRAVQVQIRVSFLLFFLGGGVRAQVQHILSPV